MQKIRYLDKLVDELAKGKTMEKILEISAGYSDDSTLRYSTKGLGGSIGFSVYF